MSKLKILKAIYYDPQVGSKKGTDVTAELSAEIRSDVLYFKGVYNFIFPDRFPGIYKRLKIEGELNGKDFLKFYNENEKINLPADLALTQESNTAKQTVWYETWWGLILIGVVIVIIGALLTNFFGLTH